MIKIICFGKIKERYLKELINDYQTRIRKYHKLEIIELKDTNDLKEEANNLEKYLNSQDFIISLDINGETMSSTKLSELINTTFIKYSNIIFIIGSSNGLSDKIKSRSQKVISFSKLTFPHGLFRGILLEQIYRSFKIINNESYHK